MIARSIQKILAGGGEYKSCYIVMCQKYVAIIWPFASFLSLCLMFLWVCVLRINLYNE